MIRMQEKSQIYLTTEALRTRRGRFFVWPVPLPAKRKPSSPAGQHHEVLTRLEKQELFSNQYLPDWRNTPRRCTELLYGLCVSVVNESYLYFPLMSSSISRMSRRKGPSVSSFRLVAAAAQRVASDGGAVNRRAMYEAI